MKWARFRPTMKMLTSGLVLLVLLALGCESTRALRPVNRELHFTGTYFEGREVPETKPVAITMGPPVYPPEFRRSRIQGEAEVWFIIGVDGRTEEVQVSTATDEAFAEAAIAAVSQWRFRPAQKGGQPVRVRSKQLIKFQIDRAR